MKDQLYKLLNQLNTPPEDISQLLKDNKHLFNWKGYGTPELEMKYLHKIFLEINQSHPAFESFSWQQYNSYNDNYYHFQLSLFNVNKILECNSDIDFYFDYDENEEIISKIRISHVDYPNPNEIEYAIQNNIPYNKEGLNEEYWDDFWNYEDRKYKHLQAPCLKFLFILKLLETRFSMYYFLYCFGHGVEVKFTKEGVNIRQLDEKEIDGQPLGTGLRFDII